MIIPWRVEKEGDIVPERQGLFWTVKMIQDFTNGVDHKMVQRFIDGMVDLQGIPDHMFAVTDVAIPFLIPIE